MAMIQGSVDEKKASLKEYDSLECPICDKERQPSSINADGSVTYICKVDPAWQESKPVTATHTQTYSWRISVDGDLLEKRGSRWIAV